MATERKYTLSRHQVRDGARTNRRTVKQMCGKYEPVVQLWTNDNKRCWVFYLISDLSLSHLYRPYLHLRNNLIGTRTQCGQGLQLLRQINNATSKCSDFRGYREARDIVLEKRNFQLNDLMRVIFANVHTQNAKREHTPRKQAPRRAQNDQIVHVYFDHFTCRSSMLKKLQLRTSECV